MDGVKGMRLGLNLNNTVYKWCGKESGFAMARQLKIE